MTDIEGCRGAHKQKTIMHTVRFRGQTIVIDNVPAEVCPVCGDVLFSPETVRQIETLLRTNTAPVRMVPMYEYA